MNKLRSIFVDNRNFFVLFSLFFITGLLFLLNTGKAASFIYLNHYHRSALDTFFINFTYLGDGIFTFVVFIILLYLRRFSQALQIITAYVLSGLLALLLKNVFSMPRPKQFFPPGEYAYFIDGVTLTGFASFPSGHSTSVFALATLLALFEKNKKWNVVYLLCAVAVGYSRIYLGQHFLGDVLVGACIGTMTAIGVHWLFMKKFRHT